MSSLVCVCVWLRRRSSSVCGFSSRARSRCGFRNVLGCLTRVFRFLASSSSPIPAPFSAARTLSFSILFSTPTLPFDWCCSGGVMTRSIPFLPHHPLSSFWSNAPPAYRSMRLPFSISFHRRRVALRCSFVSFSLLGGFTSVMPECASTRAWRREVLVGSVTFALALSVSIAACRSSALSNFPTPLLTIAAICAYGVCDIAVCIVINLWAVQCVYLNPLIYCDLESSVDVGLDCVRL